MDLISQSLLIVIDRKSICWALWLESRVRERWKQKEKIPKITISEVRRAGLTDGPVQTSRFSPQELSLNFQRRRKTHRGRGKEGGVQKGKWRDMKKMEGSETLQREAQALMDESVQGQTWGWRRDIKNMNGKLDLQTFSTKALPLSSLKARKWSVFVSVYAVKPQSVVLICCPFTHAIRSPLALLK